MDGERDGMPGLLPCAASGKKLAEGLVLTLGVVAVGDPAVIITLTGNTIDHKDAIKAQGFKWGHKPAASIFRDFLSMREPAKCWYKIIALAGDDLDASLRMVADVVNAIQSALPISTTNQQIDPLDIYSLRQNLAKKAEQAKAKAETAAAVAALDKPSRPEWMDVGRWNGKIYGNDEYGHRIYVDNKEIKLTSDQAADLLAYQAACDQYQAQIKALTAQPS
jgi:hypothetical protein